MLNDKRHILEIFLRLLWHEWPVPGCKRFIEEALNNPATTATEAVHLPRTVSKWTTPSNRSFDILLSRVAIVALICFVGNGSVRANYPQETLPPIGSLKVPDYVKVVDNTGRGAVPLGNALTPDPNKPVVIVLADELILNNEEFDYCKAAAPRQVILIADKIQLKGYARFYLSRRILGMDPQPPCSSPYLPGPSLGQTLPPVLSIVTRNLVVSREGGVCMFCQLEQGRFDTGGSAGANVESAAKPSLTIVAEQMDISAKPDFFADIGDASWQPTDDPTSTAWLPLAAIAPFFWKDSVQNDPWAKPFFDEMAARLGTPARREDIDILRRFWKAGFKAAPEKVFPGFALTAALNKRTDAEGTLKLSLDSDDLIYVDDSAVFASKLNDAGRHDPHAARAVSLWTVHTFQKIYMDLLEADRLEKRSEVLQLLRTYTSLSYPVRNEHWEAYQQAVNAIKSIRNQYENQLLRRTLQVDSNSVPLSVDLFSEGAALETYLAPTQALVTERIVEERRVLGQLRYSGTGPAPNIELLFSAELTVDPLVAEEVKKKLDQGEHYAGQFSNWELTARPIEYDGIRSSTIRISGNTLDITLRLDGRTGTLALWQLTSDHGIPLILDYEYRNDPTQKGRLATIQLSLARRKLSPVSVTPAGVSVTGQVPVTISYIKFQDGRLKTLQPQLVVSPGEVIAVPDVSAEQLAGLTVPPEAVSVNAPDPYSLNEFLNSQQVKLTEKITIKNLVPVTRLARPGNLQRLELRVVYKTDDGEEQQRDLVLAPAEITGSLKQLTFVRISQQGLREIWISGIAVYDNGSDTIAPHRFAAGDVLIDSETLAANSP